MLKENSKTHYQNILGETISNLRLIKSKLNFMIWMRLSAFLSIVFFCYLSFSISYYFIFFTSAIVVLFFYLIAQNSKLIYKKNYLTQMIWVIEQELISLNNKPTGWRDGNEFINKNHYTFDLDLFGGFSLFHLINRTSTENGAALLASFLTNSIIESQKIKIRQESVKEFASENNFRINWQTTAALLQNKGDINKILSLHTNKFFSSKLLFIYFPIVLTTLTLLSGIYYYLTNEHLLFLFFSLFNLGFVGIKLKAINNKHAQVTGINKIIQNYKELFGLYLKNQWESIENKELHETITGAEIAMYELEKICEKFDRRMNLLVSVTFNALWLNDIFVSAKLEKWIDNHYNQTNKWFDAIAKIDALQSLGTFDFNHNFTYPQLSDKPELSFEELNHPLIKEEKRIANSLKTIHPQKIILITGSNMSGKSTFLRSIGVNLVMAQAGLPVCAKSFVFKPLRICTSLRQSDSLEENVSLFHAELIRLKNIREIISNGELCLVLLDEILKGTNSEDKLHGSEKLIEEFISENIISFIATHDLTLGDLENKYKNNIRNFCFESQIINNELLFDYKLKPGIARNKNASFLLKKMQIIKH